jgi:hypothetical protein
MPKQTIEQRIARVVVRLDRITEYLEAGKAPARGTTQDAWQRVNAARAEVEALDFAVSDAS